MNVTSVGRAKQPLNLSQILSALVLSLCLIVAALIVAKPPEIFGPRADVIASEAVKQLSRQMRNRSYIGPGGVSQTVKAIVLDHCRMSPNRNRVDIEYHIVWQPGTSMTYTGLTLIKDQYGRFDSGEVMISEGDGNADFPPIHVTVD